MTTDVGASSLSPPLALAQDQGSFWMPPQASAAASEVDWLFSFIYYIALFFFALIVILMVFFVVRYRRREGVGPQQVATHSLALELTWSAVPTILVILIFWWSFTGFVSLRTPPENAYEINVFAEQWRWEFTYPNGHSDDELHVPVDTPVRLVMHTDSDDVIHSLYIPAFRIKMDIVPGRYSQVWFRATQVGEYPLVCAEYCGTGHSDMVTIVAVHEPGGYEKWLELADPLKRMTPEQYEAYAKDPQAFTQANPEFEGLEPPWQMGKRVFTKKGCKSCHTVDGTPYTGPTMKGLFGKQEHLADGSTVPVDENYLRESILAPGAKIVAGYDNVMTPYQGRISDREIAALIAYIKSLRE